MQTAFSPALLADPAMAQSEKIIRTCVHCGFCTATCPTFLLLGDELDSPRGRIYLMKDMLEKNRPADARTVLHVDRCLSCLSCMTTCPSGVNYMHLVDHARAYIEATYKRPLPDRALRALLAFVLPKPGLFRLALLGARLARPVAPLLPGRLKALVAMAPTALPAASPVDRPQVFPALGRKTARAALLNGCAQTVLDPRINEATIRLLTRHGIEVVVAAGAGCCGALAHHLGKSSSSHQSAVRNIEAWMREVDGEGLDYVVINTSGCGTTVKDYGFMFRNDPVLGDKAARISSLARDVTEVMAEVGLRPTGVAPKLRVAYHSACSMQHGQKITNLPFELLAQAGFEPVSVPEGHICCGSAGTYNLLQPDIAAQLRARKVTSIESTRCDIVATGNIGCMVQIASGGLAAPVVHTVELLDWATGGPAPLALSKGA
ncbi:MAG TPA: glycolate oxidase subunit GlcF [Beijerinckiaceae bacterium]|nr:glycolate oxidase subunit GlcF [Beijerinckiaceae bacterium]